MSQVTKFIKGECKADIVFDIGAFKGQFGNSFKQSKVFFLNQTQIISKNLSKKIKTSISMLVLEKKLKKRLFL